MKKILFSLILIMHLVASYAIDLFQTYQRAASYNASYLQALAQGQADQEIQNIARAVLLPQVGASAGFAENYFNQSSIYAGYHQLTYGANLTQVVFDFAKFSNYIKGKFAAQLADLQVNNATQQLMLQITQSYFDVLYASDVLLATKMTKEALNKQLQEAKLAFKVGTVTIADVNDALAGYDAAQAQEIQDLNNLIMQKNIFRNLTGADPEQVQPIADGIDLTPPSPNTDSAWWAIAKSNNLNIKIANAQVLMAKEDIRIASAGHYPSINFSVQYAYQDTPSVDNTNANSQQLQNFAIPGSPLSTYSTVAAGVQLSIPIFSGGGVSAATRQAQSNYSAAIEQSVDVNRQTEQNIRNAYWQVQNGINIVKAQKTALESARVKLNSDQLGYQVGVRNSVDLVAAQKNYYQAFQSYQQARYQYLVAEAQLSYLSGKIDLLFLKKLNANIKN